jgi:hypothetical protein
MKTRYRLYTVFALLTALVLIRCNEEDGTVCSDNVGPVSCADFASVTPPTYQQLITCYDEAIATDAGLLQNDSLLARAIFNCVKAAPVQNPPDKPLFDLQSRMCPEEWRLAMLYPKKVYAAIKNAVTQSLEEAKRQFPEDADVQFNNSKADAFRHSYYALLIAKSTDTTFAKKMALARLSCSGNQVFNRMDVHNDTVGVGLVRRFPTGTADELINLLLERRYYYIESPNSSIPADAGNALVFYAARRIYDVAYKGTMTNPDGPGTWNATYYFNQTGNTIRGEATYTLNSGRANRRFSGTLNSNTIELNLSYPYVFEISPGYTPCRNMKTILTINQDVLNGPWTSTNCGQGGVNNLTKQ